MKQFNLKNTAAMLALTAGTFATLPVHAHIDMAGAILSRGGDQKSFPCDGSRGDGPTYTFEPGATITLSVSENIPHPSYFRIAFDDDGDDAFVEPKSIKPIDPNRGCPWQNDPNDKCGESDYCNMTSSTGGPTVLWDNIEPHMAGGLKTYTWNVKLPNVECENCTIQVLQIMEDTVHGAYCPTGSCTDSSLEDIYHRCIDITLKKGAMSSAGTTTAAEDIKGMQCTADAAPTPGTGGAGGAPATAGTGAAGTSAAGAAAAGSGGTGASNPAAGAGGTGVAGTGSVSAGSAGRASTGVGVMTMGATAAGKSASAGTGSTPSTAAGTGSAAIAGTGAALAPPAAGDDGGCSVASAGLSRQSAAAGWLLLIAAFGFVRRRRFI